jgi:hypothetical protein
MFQLVDAAEKLSTPETTEARRARCRELKKKLITVGEKLGPLLPKIRRAAIEAGTTFPAGITSTCEFAVWLASQALEMCTPPPDDAPGLLPFKLRKLTRNEKRKLELNRKRAAERWNVLRQQWKDEIGLTAQFTTPPSDGPHAPNQLSWGGESDTLEPIPWKLVNYMWSIETAAIRDVMEAAWGHECTGEALKAALRKANDALTKLAVPWSLSKQSSYIVRG